MCPACSQLFVKHFMLGPGQTGQCVGCSFEVDHVEGILAHLENHDVSYAVVARAPIEEIEAIRKRMGWRFTWVSSYRNDFNYDFNVSFRPEDVGTWCAYYNYRYGNPGLEDLSGDSVFFRNDAGEIFHTYSAYGRGGEEFLGAYRYLDAIAFEKWHQKVHPDHSLRARRHEVEYLGDRIHGMEREAASFPPSKGAPRLNAARRDAQRRRASLTPAAASRPAAARLARASRGRSRASATARRARRA